MDNVVVYIEAWQMQCCGEPFAKGDVVSWEAFVATDSLEIDGETVNIDFYEEHHTTHRHIMFQITGQVERVLAEYSPRVEGQQNIEYSKSKKCYIDCCEEVDGWNFPQDVSDWGYVVWLSNVRLKLLKKTVVIRPDLEELGYSLSEDIPPFSIAPDGRIDSEEICDLDGKPIVMLELYEWQKEIEPIVIAFSVGEPYEKDWVDYHRRGLDIAHKLRKILSSDFDLLYEAPLEDKSRTIRQKILIL